MKEITWFSYSHALAHMGLPGGFGKFEGLGFSEHYPCGMAMIGRRNGEHWSVTENSCATCISCIILVHISLSSDHVLCDHCDWRSRRY